MFVDIVRARSQQQWRDPSPVDVLGRDSSTDEDTSDDASVSSSEDTVVDLVSDESDVSSNDSVQMFVRAPVPNEGLHPLMNFRWTRIRPPPEPG
eukprot:12418250-Karenia_brevis.AAC.1